jgi:hypothetical protein
MTKDRAFEIWAPAESVWSRFAKSVLFSFMEDGPVHAREEALKEWSVPLQNDTAVFVDAPGAEGVAIGLSLAAQGYRPVPLYNACPFASLRSGESNFVPSVVEVRVIVAALFDHAETLSGLAIPATAPPAFLLDANRATAEPGSMPYEYFDNRSFVLTLDVPSVSFLKERGIACTVVVHDQSKLQPDLLFILLEWQRAGIRIFFQAPWEKWGPKPVTLKRPRTIVALYRRLTMRFGYRRSKNHLDAFGDIVQPHRAGG